MSLHAPGGGGSSGASGITINSTTITGGTSGRILYDNAGVVGESASFTYNDTTAQQVIGTGITTRAGVRIGHSDIDAYSGIWDTSVGSPGWMNAQILLHGGETLVNGATRLDLGAGGSGQAQITLFNTSGRGITITAGAAGSGVSAELITQTWNYNAAAFDAVSWSFTNTSSHANTNLLNIKVDGNSTLSVGKFGTTTITDNNNTSAFKFASFVSNGAEAGNVIRVGTTSAVVFTTTSDETLKNDLGHSDLNAATDRLMAYRIHDFEWKSSPGTVFRNPMARETYASNNDPMLVQPGQGKTPWAINMAGFVPDLIMSVQNLQKQVNELRGN